MSTRPIFLAIVLGAALTTNGYAGETSQKTTANTIDKKIRRYIRDLGHDRYQVRVRAARQLYAAGLPAVEPLAAVLLDKVDLETHLRAKMLLERFFKSSDPLIKKEVKIVLKKLAERETQPTYYWAEAMLVDSQKRVINGRLARTDPPDARRNNHPHKVHLFKMVRGHRYQIDMTASFDTYLRLEDANRRELARDDDGGQGLNSRIMFTPTRSGMYRIIATNFSSGGVGNYMLMVQAKGR